MKPWIIIAALLAILRVVIAFNVPPSGLSWVGSYQAAAHIFIGVLAGCAYCQQGEWWKQCGPISKWELFGMLCVIEVAAAVVSRMYWS